MWRNENPHIYRRNCFLVFKGFPVGTEVKASACNVGDLGSIPGSGQVLQQQLQGRAKGALSTSCLTSGPTSGGLRPLVELCVEPAGLCGRCTGVAVPLRVKFEGNRE